MYVMIGLSVATGLPWEYFERQSDQVVATYLDLFERARGGKGKRGGDEPAAASGGGKRPARKRQMSG